MSSSGPGIGEDEAWSQLVMGLYCAHGPTLCFMSHRGCRAACYCNIPSLS